MTKGRVEAPRDDMKVGCVAGRKTHRVSASALEGGDIRQASERLAENPDVHAALMNTMMQQMDGYAATGHEREIPRVSALLPSALAAARAGADT